MKKFLKLLALLLTLAMVVPMIPVMTFATEPELVESDAQSTHNASLTHDGQDLYSTGANYAPTSEMNIDGAINADEGWVCLTPNYVKKQQVSGYMNGSSSRAWWSADKGCSNMTTSTTYDAVWGLTSNYKFYVAQDAEHVYVAFEEDVPYLETGVGANNYVTLNVSHSYYFRLGFNPDDYLQQLVLSSDSGAPSATGLAASGTTFDTTTDRSGIVVETSAKNTYNGSSAWSKYTEVKLSKNKITAAYKASYGENTNVDFSTMFLMVSLNGASNADTITKTGEYKGPNSGTWTNDVVRALYGGTVVKQNVIVPDAIVFGEEKTLTGTCTDGANCSYTAHNVADRYKVDDNTYYHSCATCGAAGARTFKVDANGIVFNKEVVSEDTVINAYTCEVAGTYLRSCSCGRVDTDTTNAFTYGGYCVYIDEVADKYLKVSANCIDNSVYWKSCELCGTAHETETFTLNDATLWHYGEKKPVYQGQRVFYTGENYEVNDSDMTTTEWATLDYGLVKVTPSTLYGVAQSNSNQANGSLMSGVNVYETAVFQDLFTKYTYYAAKSDTTMYLTFAQLYDYQETAIEGQHSLVTWSAQTSRIGLNKYDYTQQLVINMPGYNLGGHDITFGYADAYGYTQLYTGKIKDVAAALKTALETKLGTTLPDTFKFFETIPGSSEGASIGNYVASQDVTHYHNLRFNLEGIKTFWNAFYGVELQDSDLDAAYTSITHQVYAGTHRNYAYYGSVIPAETAAAVGLSQLYPDLIVFGAEKNTCNYTAHTPDTRYLVAGTTDTYYHSCPDCGDIGTRTFKVVDGKVQYTVLEEKDEYRVDLEAEADCSKGYMYYKQCVCGCVSDETFEGTYRDNSKHDYSEELFSDKSYHWNECTRCAATTNFEKHEYNNKSDLECNVCEYVRKAPETETPATDAPTTDAPVTDAPTTDAPVTDAPTTDAPATDEPVTDEPATDAPATDEPATEAPAGDDVTDEPATEEPVADNDCNGTISLAGLALVTMLGACAAVATKKKED